tara:strand:+ start:529 stop:759 length:231 start_codon:yes stop_codon:yes gene_type:complete
MLTTGDLVRIKDDAFKYFAGKLAVVDHTAFREEYFDIDGKLHHRTYYLITLTGTSDSHVFAEHDLTIVSKAYERND